MLTFGQVRSVVALGDDVGHNAGCAASTTLLDRRGVLGRLDSVGTLLVVTGGDHDTLAGGRGVDSNRLGVDKARVLVAVQLSQVGGFARESAANTLLLNEEAGVGSDKEPLKILGCHDCRIYMMVGGSIATLYNDLLVCKSVRLQ